MEIEYKESKDNPLHREYGIWSNTVYILKKMWQYKPGVLFLVILGIVSAVGKTDKKLPFIGDIFDKIPLN